MRRTRKRFAVLLASAAVLGVGLIAFPGGAVAAAPVQVPTCTFPNTPGSDSCDKLLVNAVNAPIGPTLEPVGLGVRVRSRFTPASSETTSVTLRFDDNIALNLAGIPSCPSSELTGKNVAQAWEQCGPGADGSPPSEGNAYLSPPTAVSGYGSTVPPGNLTACTMIFKGADNNHLTIYSRAPETTAACNGNPATNSGGSVSVIFTGVLTHQPASSPYNWQLKVNGTDAATPALDDFSAFIRRGSAFRANCPSGTSPLKLQGIWDYTAAGDANDTSVSNRPCP
jgi:hypothetical protein